MPPNLVALVVMGTQHKMCAKSDHFFFYFWSITK